MIPYEDAQYLTIYADDDYMIWLDMDEKIINIFLAQSGLTLHFAYEDFEAFKNAINNLKWLGMDEKIDIFMEERGLTLHFAYENFQTFREMLNGVEMLPKSRICWN